MDTQAPKEQLLITSETITEVVRKIYVKKSNIINPEIVNELRHLCKVAEKETKGRRAAERMHEIFQLRKQMLESASEIYIEVDETILFEEATEELGVIIDILEKHTLTK